LAGEWALSRPVVSHSAGGGCHPPWGATPRGISAVKPRSGRHLSMRSPGRHLSMRSPGKHLSMRSPGRHLSMRSPGKRPSMRFVLTDRPGTGE